MPLLVGPGVEQSRTDEAAACARSRGEQRRDTTIAAERTTAWPGLSKQREVPQRPQRKRGEAAP